MVRVPAEASVVVVAGSVTVVGGVFRRSVVVLMPAAARAQASRMAVA